MKFTRRLFTNSSFCGRMLMDIIPDAAAGSQKIFQEDQRRAEHSAFFNVLSDVAGKLTGRKT